MSDRKVACAIVGTGNIGTDLMYKLMESDVLELRAMVGIDPESEGLLRAQQLGIEATHRGVDWLMDRSSEIDLVFEATSAQVFKENAVRYEEAGLRAIDLTPARLGPLVVPSVNLAEYPGASALNLVTCGGQATVPIVAAVDRVAKVPYAEIVSAVASVSAGPGTRQNIDEFTKTTAGALEEIGGAMYGKAIIILNPANPPILMRNTVYCALPEDYESAAVLDSIMTMVDEVKGFVPGYRLRSDPVIETDRFVTPGGETGARVVTMVEVEGAGHFLPPYAGNLDIMTAAAVRVGEACASEMLEAV